MGENRPSFCCKRRGSCKGTWFPSVDGGQTAAVCPRRGFMVCRSWVSSLHGLRGLVWWPGQLCVPWDICLAVQMAPVPCEEFIGTEINLVEGGQAGVSTVSISWCQRRFGAFGRSSDLPHGQTPARRCRYHGVARKGHQKEQAALRGPLDSPWYPRPRDPPPRVAGTPRMCPHHAGIRVTSVHKSCISVHCGLAGSPR